MPSSSKARSIVLNATGSDLAAFIADACFIKPVRIWTGESLSTEGESVNVKNVTSPRFAAKVYL